MRLEEYLWIDVVNDKYHAKSISITNKISIHIQTGEIMQKSMKYPEKILNDIKWNYKKFRSNLRRLYN